LPSSVLDLLRRSHVPEKDFALLSDDVDAVDTFRADLLALN
jgi:hypothetical protein